MICVAPASRLFSSISFSALAGLCRRTGAAAERSGGGILRQAAAAQRHVPLLMPADLLAVQAALTHLDDLPGSNAVHHRLVQPPYLRQLLRRCLPICHCASLRCCDWF